MIAAHAAGDEALPQRRLFARFANDPAIREEMKKHGVDFAPRYIRAGGLP